MIHPIKVLKEITNYVRNPIADINNDDKLMQKIKFIITSILIMIILKVFFGAITATLNAFDIVDFTNHTQEKIKNQPILEKILMVALIAPLFEELAFRLYLKWKVNFIIISFSLIFLWFFNKYYLPTNKGLINTENITSKLYFLLACVSILSALMIPFITKIKMWGKMNFKFIFYFAVVTFAFMHIQNYTITTTTILFSPLIIMPQLLGGTNDAYIRMKYGIVWSFGAHMLNNLIFIAGSQLF